MADELNGANGADGANGANDNDNTQYIDAITKLKANSISIDKYKKLETENAKLLDTLINGGTIGSAAPAADKVDVQELRAKMFTENNGMSNLEMAENSLKLRKAIMDDGGPDIFLPVGANISPTAFDIESAQEVAEAMQHCIDYADGDPEIFTNELMRITIDAMPMYSRR